METIDTGHRAARRLRKRLPRHAPAGILACGLAAVLAFAGSAEAAKAKHCTATAKAMSLACRYEARDDYEAARAICINVSDEAEREACLDEARDEGSEARETCSDQQSARRDLCEIFGEERYDPPFDPASFEDDFANPVAINPYHPLGIGYRWEYAAGSETIDIEVLNETKQIEGVTCIVVRDVVRDDGDLVEDTDDWIALAANGDAWYCGEEVKDYEFFDGDSPRLPELVSNDGSFKHGRDGAKAGIRFPAIPVEGEFFRQEFALGDAEDIVEVLETDYEYGDDPELDELVPEALVDHLCEAGGCVVTRDFTPLDPDEDAFERKYYAPGIGVFFETKPSEGTATRLVGCSFDPRCESLP